MASSQSPDSPASTRLSSSRGRGGKAPLLRWLPIRTCAGNWKPARTAAAPRQRTRSRWRPWSAACRSCGTPRPGWSPPTTGCGAWPAAGSSPRWRRCCSTPRTASRRASAARSSSRRCWRGGGPGTKGRNKSQRRRKRALRTAVNVQGPVSSCLRHSHSRRSTEPEGCVPCPVLTSGTPVAPFPAIRTRATGAGRKDEGQGRKRAEHGGGRAVRTSGKSPSQGHSISTRIHSKT